MVQTFKIEWKYREVCHYIPPAPHFSPTGDQFNLLVINLGVNMNIFLFPLFCFFLNR